MPTASLRELISQDRTRRANRRLGALLCFVAGAMNAGGFILLHRYSSHMTGIVSAMADDLTTGAYRLVYVGALLVGAFLLGAALTAVIVNLARRFGWKAEYAACVALEALLLLIFGLSTPSDVGEARHVIASTALLCFVMGLQNAIVTKISAAEIRTTHVTGLVTDIGIELGRIVSRLFARQQAIEAARQNLEKLSVHSLLLLSFIAGGVCGAFGFQVAGATASFPLAVILFGISVPSLVRDVLQRSSLR
jgi:uncharacterized membrane protein YoaK (UPF0700 family)